MSPKGTQEQVVDEEFLAETTKNLQANRPCMEDYIILKRTSSWVRRYAFIDGPARMLYYKNTKVDQQWKYSIDLRYAKVNKGLRNGTQPFLYIEPDAKEISEVLSDGRTESHSFITSTGGGSTYKKARTSVFSKKKKGPQEALKITCETTPLLNRWYYVASIASFSDQELHV